MKKGLIILLLVCTCVLSAVSDKAGTTGFTFSRLMFSPRASAMAGAYAGVADDAEAVFYNPAGMFQIKERSISAVYMSYLLDINCGAISYTHPYSKKSAAAVYTRFLSTEETRTLCDEHGNYLGTDGTFGASSLELGAAGAYHFSESLNLGAAVKILYDNLDGNSATAAAVDIGLYHITTNPKLHLGIVLRNTGIQLSSYTDEEYEEKLPTTAGLGFGFRASEKLLLSADVYKPLNTDYYGKFGFEYKIHEMLKIRLGYKTAASDWQKGGDGDALAGFSGGFALKWQKYVFNYAFLSYGDLGIVNQLSLVYNF